eukprot:5527736-Amphidinium_carterae.1
MSQNGKNGKRPILKKMPLLYVFFSFPLGGRFEAMTASSFGVWGEGGRIGLGGDGVEGAQQ